MSAPQPQANNELISYTELLATRVAPVAAVGLAGKLAVAEPGSTRLESIAQFLQQQEIPEPLLQAMLSSPNAFWGAAAAYAAAKVVGQSVEGAGNGPGEHNRPSLTDEQLSRTRSRGILYALGFISLVNVATETATGAKLVEFVTGYDTTPDVWDAILGTVATPLLYLTMWRKQRSPSA